MASITEANSLFEIDIELDELLEELNCRSRQKVSRRRN